MKYSIASVVAMISLLLFSNFIIQASNLNDGYIEVYFSKKLNLKDLAKIQSDLSSKEINLNYNYLRFNDDGKLLEIEYHVSTKTFGATDMSKNLDVEIGFVINTSSPSKFGIIAGTKEQVKQGIKDYNK